MRLAGRSEVQAERRSSEAFAGLVTHQIGRCYDLSGADRSGSNSQLEARVLLTDEDRSLWIERTAGPNSRQYDVACNFQSSAYFYIFRMVHLTQVGRSCGLRFAW